MNIQKIFTKLRNEINNREDQLLLDVDKKFEELYFNEDIIKESEKLPNKIKISLEKGKLIDINWKENKLNSLINDCLNIENNIENINKINKSLNKCNSFNFNIKFYPEENEINQLLETIKNFGIINDKPPKIFDSKIEFDEKLVISWLNNKNFKFELLFRKTRDGSTPNDFHNKCDNKGITIVFIETTKGYKFGGYTELEWDESNSPKTDNSTFLFSINNKAKYTKRNSQYCSIYCRKDLAPSFGGDLNPDIFCMGSCKKGQLCKTNTFATPNELNNGEEFFDVKEMEVYQIKLI